MHSRMRTHAHEHTSIALIDGFGVLLAQALGFGGEKFINFIAGRSGLFFWKFISNMIWSYFFSTLATVIICARIVGWTFREYHIIYYGPGEAERSNLWKMNVYQRDYYSPDNASMLQGANKVHPADVEDTSKA